MKKLFLLPALLALVLFTPEIASAGGSGYGFSLFLSFPPIIIGPPAIVAPPPTYYPPPPGYDLPPGAYDYPPPPVQSYSNYRVWVPGHWEDQQTDRGWERVYVLGYWEENP